MPSPVRCRPALLRESDWALSQLQPDLRAVSSSLDLLFQAVLARRNNAISGENYITPNARVDPERDSDRRHNSA